MDIYGLICYAVIIDWMKDKSPDYILEKSAMIGLGADAYRWLDPRNQAKAVDYCKKWGVAVPPGWEIPKLIW